MATSACLPATPPTPGPSAARPGVLRGLSRLLYVWWVLFAEYRAYRRFLRGAGDPLSPQRLARRLARLGPTFIKLAQVLSTRADVVAPAYAEALATLQEAAPPLAFETVRRTVEAELGAPLAESFERFDEAPAASASLAQVHRARLRDGTDVAVKVQRPDLLRLVERDLEALSAGLRVLAWLFPARLRRANLVAFFDEFARYTRLELDFELERSHLERFASTFADRADVKVPAAIATHSTRRVLTMTWVDGLRVSQAAAALTDEEKTALTGRLVDVLLKMFVSDGFFHADLHPGNVVFHRDGSLTLLDFGMVGELTGGQRDRFILYWLAVAQRQTRRAFHHFKAQTHPQPGADEQAFFQRFAQLAERFYAAPLREMSFARVYLAMLRAGYDFGFVFPRELMLHAKALTTAEALVFVLAPEARFEAVSRPFIVRELVARMVSGQALQRRLAQLLPELLLLGELAPGGLDEGEARASSGDLLSSMGEQLARQLARLIDRQGPIDALLEADVRATLAGTPLEGAVQALLTQTWRRTSELTASLPPQPTVGATMTTRLAAATLALDEALRSRGLTADASHRLVYDVGWRFYARMGAAVRVLVAAVTPDPSARLRLATELFRQFPFGAPAYLWEDVPSAADVVAFDCTRCPVADFFARHDASALCVDTWCALDVPLAAQWGSTLHRTGTLATGASRCDFRWRVGQAAVDDRDSPGHT